MRKIKQKLKEYPIIFMSDNVNDKYEQLKQNLILHTRDATCNKIIKIRQKVLPPWFDLECRRINNIKNYWHRKHIKNYENEHVKKEYKFWRNKYTSIKRKKQISYDNNIFQKTKGNPSKTWKHIKNIINPCPKNQNGLFHDKNADDKKKGMKLNEFNQYYANVGKTLAAKFNKVYVPKIRTTSRFKFKLISLNETKNLINNLTNTTATGYDEIQTKTIKYCQDELILNIRNLINTSLICGEVPEGLKISKVIPIYKGDGDKNEVCNYRPISISSILSKLLETYINNQLSNYLSKNNLMDKQQYGFRNCSNTNAALFDLITEVQAGVSKKQRVAVVFFDLAKAFDSVDRKILLRILLECGVFEKEHKWFKNYLSGRKQYTEYEQYKSKIEDIEFGVIQGSSLGPTLFACYISSFSKLKLKAKAFLYADDIAIVFRENNYTELEKQINLDLKEISEWMKIHKLTVNINKTKYMLIKKQMTAKIKIMYSGTEIEEVDIFKYLGIYIDAKLNWNQQSNEIAKKTRRIAGVFKLAQKRVPYEQKSSIFYCLFHSTISYGIIVWGNTYLKNMAMLQRIQNKAIKNLYGLNHRSSTTEIHKRFGILTLELHKKMIQAMQIHNMKTKKIKTNVDIIQNSEMHSYSTRTANNIHLHYSETFNIAIKIFNELPLEIKITEDKKIKTKMKQHFFNFLL